MRILVPVKRFSVAKERLATCLPPAARSALAQAMAEDILEKLTRLRGIDGIMIVSDEPSLEAWKHRYSFELFRPVKAGLNAGLDEALRWQAAGGTSRALLLHSDLPAARLEEIQQLVDAKEETIVVPDRHMRGTNAMVLPCPARFTPAFGTPVWRAIFASHKAPGRMRLSTRCRQWERISIRKPLSRRSCHWVAAAKRCPCWRKSSTTLHHAPAFDMFEDIDNRIANGSPSGS